MRLTKAQIDLMKQANMKSPQFAIYTIDGKIFDYHDPIEDIIVGDLINGLVKHENCLTIIHHGIIDKYDLDHIYKIRIIK